MVMQVMKKPNWRFWGTESSKKHRRSFSIKTKIEMIEYKQNNSMQDTCQHRILLFESITSFWSKFLHDALSETLIDTLGGQIDHIDLFQDEENGVLSDGSIELWDVLFCRIIGIKGHFIQKPLKK